MCSATRLAQELCKHTWVNNNFSVVLVECCPGQFLLFVAFSMSRRLLHQCCIACGSLSSAFVFFLLYFVASWSLQFWVARSTVACPLPSTAPRTWYLGTTVKFPMQLSVLSCWPGDEMPFNIWKKQSCHISSPWVQIDSGRHCNSPTVATDTVS